MKPYNRCTLGILLVIGLGTVAGAQFLVSKEATPASLGQNPLYLHLLSPAEAAGGSSRRVASTRIYLGQDFSVSTGDTENPFTKQWTNAFTLPLVDTNGVPAKRPLGTMWDSGDAVLAGRIELREGKLFAQLQARNQDTLLYFTGPIEIEKPFEEQGGWHRGVVRGVWFVLSQSPDCTRYLRALDNGTLRSPHVVPIDSPEAKQWLAMDSLRGHGSGDTESPTKDASAQEKSMRILELRMVYDQPTPNATELEMTRTTPAGETITQRFIVGKRALLDVSSIQSATLTTNPLSKDPGITIHFTEAGKKQFAKITSESVGRQIAIIIEGKLISAPRIDSEIPSGSAVIHGDFTAAEAKEIAAKISEAANSRTR